MFNKKVYGQLKKKLGIKGKAKPGEMIKKSLQKKEESMKHEKGESKSFEKKEEKKPKLGSGARFKTLTKKLAGKGAKNPKALAAFIGRKKYGNKKMASLAKKGKK